MPSISKTLQISYNDARNYPCNLLDPNEFVFNLKAYQKKLENRKEDLFSPSSETDVHLLEKQLSSDAYEPKQIGSFQDLHQTLIPHGYDKAAPDAHQRHFFLYAPHSRASLRVSREVFARLLTYYQVMPAFLDYVIPFGDQIKPRDSHFSGFKGDVILDTAEPGLEMAELNRSGYGFRHCYNLKSVEPSRGQVDHPYSIRQTAIYHSIDTQTGASTWITVKGSQLIKERVTAALQQTTNMPCDSFESSFRASLIVHLVLAQWSDEHWRGYINFLDDELGRISSQVLTTPIDQCQDEPEPARLLASAPRAATMLSEQSETPAPSLVGLLKACFLHRSTDKEASDCELGRIKTDPQPHDIIIEPRFDFQNVQELASLEEYASAARRVLRSNVNTLRALKSHYVKVWNHTNFPMMTHKNCQSLIAKFDDRLDSIIDDMERHEFNLGNMLAAVDVRRNVLNNMFTYQNIKSSEKKAEKAQKSAENMEDMTEIMFKVARKTERETVAMKVITLVTLFFLPATFICTFMSTGIVQYANNNNNGNTSSGPGNVFSPDALKFFFELSIPFMLFTLLSWWFCHQWVKFRTDGRYRDMYDKLMQKAKANFGTRL